MMTERAREIERAVEEIIEIMDKQWEEDRIGTYDDLIMDVDDDDILMAAQEAGLMTFMETVSGADIPDAVVARALKLSSEFHSTNRLHTMSGEIYSLPIGEVEYEISIDDHEELAALIDTATHEELVEVRCFSALNVIKYGSFLAYGRPCERLVWIANAAEAAAILGIDQA